PGLETEFWKDSVTDSHSAVPVCPARVRPFSTVHGFERFPHRVTSLESSCRPVMEVSWSSGRSW
ncbi:unnamed protein product, partial [Gulo gulo]